MADPTRYPDTGVEPDREATTGTSRWQMVVGIIGLVMVLGLGLWMFGPDRGGRGPGDQAPGGNQEQQVGTENGGDHGPRRH